MGCQSNLAGILPFSQLRAIIQIYDRLGEFMIGQ
ncbi:hypothetical protein J2S21_004077 [Peribacillus cavernae]|nr:hypothetical protein [Peribacillus cavernae]